MYSVGLSELVLVVRDVARCARFYREIVRLEPDGEGETDWAWFWCGARGSPQRLGLTNRKLLFEEHSPHPAGRRFGQAHFALNVPRPLLESAVGHARKHGLRVYGPTRFEWMKAESYYLFDPDGNLVEYWSPDDPAPPVAPPTFRRDGA